MKILKKNGKPICRKIAVANSEGYDILDIDDILYLKSEGTYTVFHIGNNLRIVACKNIGYFAEKLLNEDFIRVHNSIIVNLNKITKFKKTDGGCLILSNGEKIEVSRNKKIELVRLIKQLC